MIRIPRDVYGQARATLNFCTVWNGKRVLLDTFGVCGSTRTAKMAAIRAIQNMYRPKLAACRRRRRVKETDQLCAEMEELLSCVQALE